MLWDSRQVGFDSRVECQGQSGTPRVDEPVKCDEGLLKGQIADPDHIDGARVYPSRHVSYALGL
jgi:hypothetical protein